MNLYSYAETACKPGWSMRKIIMVMKLIFFIITIACVQVSAVGYSQNVNIQQKNATLTTVFSSIEKQTGYNFFWKDADLTAIKVDVKLQNASLEEALKEIFNGLPLTYSITKKSIVVQAKAPSFFEKVAAVFTDIDVKGAVYDKEGKPLPGATVTVKGGKRSASTNVKGEFSLTNVAKDAVLQVSYMGYVTKEVPVNSTFVPVVLELSTSKLDEVQVMAYGTTNRRLSTGNIGTVTAKEIEKQPVMNPLLALAGRVPGVSITPTSGYASGTVKVEIRGRSSINGNFASEPLYIIDGVPLTYLEVGGTSNYETGSSGIVQNGMYVPGGGQSPLFNLNREDIESIDILKDGDATAIYGSRGANGVIMITTKKGKPGATKVTANVYQGISKVTRYWDMLNTREYLNMRRQAFKNDGIVPTATNAPDLIVWDTTRYTNWQKALWGNTGRVTSASTSFSGGTNNTVFRVSGNYGRQTEIMTASGANKEMGMSFSLNNRSLNNKFKTALNASYSFSDVNNVAMPSAVTLAPNAPPIYNSVGELNFDEWNAAGIGSLYPFGTLKGISKSQNKFLKGNLLLSYELLKGLEASTSLGYNSGHNVINNYSPISAQNPIDNPTGIAITGFNDNQNFLVEPQLKYNTTISKGLFSAFLGGTYQSTETSGQNIMGFGYTDDNLLESIQLAPIKQISDRSGNYKYAGLSVRLGYNWDETYIINLTGRRDGSSRFGLGKQYGNFGSIGLAWTASKESWLKDVLPEYISFLKFRGSYALTGSDNIGDYKYLTQWSNERYSGTSLPQYGGVIPLVSLHAVNPDYHWQVTRKLEGGMSISFLKDRINIEANVYRDRCDNQLTDYPTPLFSGFPDVTANWPASVQNSGWEAMVNANLMKTENFSWSVNFNISQNKNKLLKYPDIENSPYASSYVVGKPINIRYLLHYIGVNPMTGQYAFEDYNRNGNIDQLTAGQPGLGYDDRYVIYNPDPKFTGGFGTEIKYKDLELSLFFQYKNQLGKNANYTGGVPGAMLNISKNLYGNQWTQPGQIAQYARFTTVPSDNDRTISGSDLIYTDASFLRLNNVSLSYTLPRKLMKNGKTLNVYINAQNLLTITGYKGIDPDVQDFGGLPTAKIITAGLSLTL